MMMLQFALRIFIQQNKNKWTISLYIFIQTLIQGPLQLNPAILKQTEKSLILKYLEDGLFQGRRVINRNPL